MPWSIKECRAIVDQQWRLGEFRVNWSEMESVVRDVLKAYGRGHDAHECLLLIDDAVAAFTRRGNELQQPDVVEVKP